MHLSRSLILLLAVVLPTLANMASAMTNVPVSLRPDQSSIALNASVGVLEDPRGELTLEDIKSRTEQFRAPAIESESGLNFGYSRSVWWIKIDLQRPLVGTPEWLLEIAFPQLDRIDFFGADGEHFAAGDTLPAASQQIMHRHFVFPVFTPRAVAASQPAGDVSASTDTANGANATIYLRVASNGILVVPLTLWHSAAFHAETQTSYVMLTLLYGVILMLGLFNLILFKDFGDKVYLNFALYAFAIVFAQFSVNGFAAELLWPRLPEWGNIAPLVGAAICGCFGMLFTRRFLNTARTAHIFDGAILAFAGLFALSIFTPLFLSAPLVSIQLSFVATGGLLVTLLAAIQGMRQGANSARWFLLASFPLFIAVAATVLRNINILPVSFLTLHGVRISIELHVLILSYALAQRISATQHERDALQFEAIKTRQELVDVLRQSEQQLESRVTERTDALEQANARLRENERQLKDAAHSDPLTGLANRLLLDVHLQHAIKTARRDKSSFALLLIDLDKFKPVNDTYGHAIGDDVLRAVAQRLRSTVREMDTVARLGGDEFVIVLRSVGNHHDVELVATKITLAIAQPIKVLGVPIEIGASVGIALFEPGLNVLGDLLRRADSAMYEVKKSGGSGHRFYAAKPTVRAEPEAKLDQGNRAA
ncbi:MAG: diguanylate cyclase [Rhodocyclaceae bacterium]|nr:diguanylate cyclase [Rhodocyclaceae bacterium]